MLVIVRWLVICILAGCGFSGSSGTDGVVSDARLDGPTDPSGDGPGPDAAGDAGVDAPADASIITACDACVLADGICEGGGCKFTCDDANSCSLVSCPPGQPCTVECNGQCGAGVDCTRATECNITCTNGGCGVGVLCGGGPCTVVCDDACGGGVTCGTDACNVDCRNDACGGGLRCGLSCACDATCDNTSCGNGASCGLPTCDDGRGCDSTQSFECDLCS